MPIYEYECKNCASRFEKMQPITAEPLTECVNCGGGPIHRIFHPVGVIFKGSGWYINDSRKSSNSKEDGGGAGASDKSTGDKSNSDKNTSDKTASSESTTAPSKEASKDAPASASASE